MSDVDSHYKNTIRIQLTAADIRNEYVDVVIDPYLISKARNVGGGAMEHIMKKSVRGPDKGHTVLEVFEEIAASANRGIELELNTKLINKEAQR